MINHSCVPNAVVVFPSFPKSAAPSSAPSPSPSKNMAVVALRDLERGEEVVTSYVDLSLPREERQKELQERYKFVCHCEGCSDSAGVDPREAMLCPAAAKSSCEGLIAIPGQSTDLQQGAYKSKKAGG
ncbi:MAG: SET domain-containing protein [Microbacterium hominis]|nr:SET domain-containing protein [Microbacterium hominis]